MVQRNALLAGSWVWIVHLSVEVNRNGEPEPAVTRPHDRHSHVLCARSAILSHMAKAAQKENLNPLLTGVRGRVQVGAVRLYCLLYWLLYCSLAEIPANRYNRLVPCLALLLRWRYRRRSG